jgi:hypothetical protein
MYLYTIENIIPKINPEEPMTIKYVGVKFVIGYDRI